MKSTKQLNKIKSRAMSVLICTILILCAVLSFFALVPAGIPSAEEDPNKTVNGIRFVQVAAGEDFAIGLTYDGDLYGWSLIDNGATKTEEERTGNALSITLGDYYTATPTKIDVKFRQGPGANGDDWSSGVDAYHRVITNDRIKKIVATRTTAAFLTENGYIYTWGKDIDIVTKDTAEGVQMEELEDNTRYNYMLLRGVGDQYPWYNPYIIDYYYYGGNDAMGHAVPAISGNNINTTTFDIAAGEYNYIITYATSGATYSYVWGSLLYNNVNTQNKSSYDYVTVGNSFAPDLKGGLQAHHRVAIKSNVRAVAGGYNVGFNTSSTSANTTLQLRGRNFLTSQYDGENQRYYNTMSIATATVNDAAHQATSNITYSQSGTSYNVTGGIAGGQTVNGNPTDQEFSGLDIDLYYGVLSSGTTYAFANPVAKNITDAHGSQIASLPNGDGDPIAAAQIMLYGVSLGNDVGYGIVYGSGENQFGRLYGWGDNAYGQLGNANGGFNPTPVLISSSVNNFVSVAAGKQLSSINKPMYVPDSLVIDGEGDSKKVTGFKPDVSDEDGIVQTAGVQNGADFITGAITADGKLYVWSNKNSTPAEITYGFAARGSVQNSDRFVAVYSGYGNNLFAITATGKLVRIQCAGSEYEQYRYDTFNDGSANVVNWEVAPNNGVANDVTFRPAAAKDDEPAVVSPDLGKATFYVWDVRVSGADTDPGTVEVNGGGENAKYNSLVKSNAIGDVYRIMGLSSDDDKLPITGTRDGKFLSDNGTATSFKPMFKYGKDADYASYTIMTDAQWNNMFSMRYVVDNNGVGIEITPKKSSKGYKIAMEFYVARYNSETNFSGTSSTEYTDNAQYYDYKPCRITFTIADTPTVKTFEAFDSENGGKSSLPLLDPNNEYNKNYSVAVQDVSSGVVALLRTMGVQDSDINGDNGVMSKIIAAMNVGDKGFPAKSKIGLGNLTYYLGNDVGTRYYTDVYQYLFTDRDGDIVKISKLASGMMTGGQTAGSITGDTVPVHITNIDTGIVITENNTVAGLLAKIAAEFDNVYGIYNVVVTENAETHTAVLAFDYDVMTFTANYQSGFVAYGDGGVSDFQTVEESAARVWANVNANVSPASYNANFAGIADEQINNFTDARYIAAVFSQPSLRISHDYAGNKLDTVYTGNFGGNNKYTEVFKEPIVVGDSVTINLDKYFDTRSGDILYAYGGASTTAAFTDFENLFTDQTGALDQANRPVKVVALTQSTLTVTPTTALPIDLDIQIKRYSNSQRTEGFGTDTAPDETLTINLVFGNIVDFTFQKSNTQNTSEYDAEYMITKTETIDVISGGRFVTIRAAGQSELSTSKIEELLKKVKISRPVTFANNDVFSVTPVAGSNTAFTITPLSSGVGYIQFTASILNKSLVFTVAVNVSSVTTFNTEADTITVVEDKYIAVDDIKSKLEQKNKFNANIGNYKVLYNDVANPDAAPSERKYNALYFTNSQGVEETPIFVKNAVFESADSKKYSIRIISSNNASSVQEQYYLHIRFTSDINAATYAEAEDGTVIEAVFPVKSGKALLPVSVNIDAKNLNASTVTGSLPSGQLASEVVNLHVVDGSIQISLTELLTAASVQIPNGYTVVILRTDVETAKYFGYRTDAIKQNIIITPNYNTPDVGNEDVPYGPELEVSASNGTLHTVITFNVSVSGILTVLPVMQENGIIGYGNIWIYSALIVFGVLALIFIIRLIVYWKKRAKQRAIIKRNQELIRMRDRIHAKGTAATREQMVKTKLKMGDPKYAKMMNEMRKSRQEENGGVILENSDIAATTIDTKSKKKKKKKGGKKTVAELKAELEAKKAAFAAAQAQSAQPVDPFVQDVPLDGGAFDAPGGDFAEPNGDFGGVDGDFGGAQSIDGGEIIFDATDMNDGM